MFYIVWGQALKVKKTFYILLVILLGIKSGAQTPNYLFHNNSEKDGLSFNFIHTLLRDSKGMMWIGSHNGLNRYDGQHFYQFNARKDSNSFIDNSVFDLCEDTHGNIWGSTGGGIFCYDLKQNKFKNYFPPGYDYARAVFNILCDKRGDIWATGVWTILKLNKKKNIFEEIGPLTKIKDSLSYYAVRQNGMLEDPSGKGLWLATRLGLHFYNIKENKFYCYKNMSSDSLFVKHGVSALSWSKFGYFWFFDNDTKEMKAFDPSSHKILYRISIKSTIPDAVATTLFEDSNHKLWLSTWNYQIAVIDYKKKKAATIAYKKDNPLSIAGDIFWGILEDEDNTIWIGTSGGLSRCNYTKSVYSIYPISDNVKEFSGGKLGAFANDPRNNTWWIASEHTPSVIHYNPDNSSYIFYDFSKAQKNSKGQLPTDVYNFSFTDGQIYIFTHTGIWLIDEKTKKILPFNKKFKGLPDLQLASFVRNDSIVWFSAWDKGFIKWNKITNKAKLIKASEELLPDSQHIAYTHPVIDRKGRPWFIPAFGWIGHVNEKDEVEMKFYVKDKFREMTSYISQYAFDSKDNLWMTSVAAGLYRYNIHTGEIKIFENISGIGTVPGNMAIDKKDRVWIVSFKNYAIYNPETGGANWYHIPLYENIYNYSNILKQGIDGSIFGTLNRDIIKFLPDKLDAKPEIKPPLISIVKISGKEKLINDETSLLLEPDENSLEFSFGSLINKDIFPYTLKYRLDGFDTTWIENDATAKALYSNLRPGKYVFHVIAISKNKTWKTPERTIYVTIKTPFYLSGWFWSLIGILLITALIVFYRYRLNKQKEILTLENKAQELEKEKAMVMYENLKQQLNPHFLFNSLTSLSGLIETDQYVAVEFLEQISGIYRYILKNGDNETVTLKDEVNFVTLYINLQQTRFKNGLQININIPDEYLHYKIAPVTLQNLIENAIKHNIIDITMPLVIDIYVEGDYVIVKNNLQKKNMVETSNKKGLAQFTTLYKYLSTRPVTIKEEENKFIIKIPLI